MKLPRALRSPLILAAAAFCAMPALAIDFEPLDVRRLADFAEYSEAAYLDGSRPAYVTDIKTDTLTGFKAVAIDVPGSNPKKIVVSFAGTEDLRDIVADVLMVSGMVPKQFAHAEAFYSEIKAKYPDADIELTGHSLGGSIATYVAEINDAKATVFNAYGLGPDIKNAIESKTGHPLNPDLITHVRMDCDGVSGLGTTLTGKSLIGTVITLPGAAECGVKVSVSDHKIGAIREALENVASGKVDILEVRKINETSDGLARIDFSCDREFISGGRDFSYFDGALKGQVDGSVGTKGNVSFGKAEKGYGASASGQIGGEANISAELDLGRLGHGKGNANVFAGAKGEAKTDIKVDLKGGTLIIDAGINAFAGATAEFEGSWTLSMLGVKIVAGGSARGHYGVGAGASGKIGVENWVFVFGGDVDASIGAGGGVGGYIKIDLSGLVERFGPEKGDKIIEMLENSGEKYNPLLSPIDNLRKISGPIIDYISGEFWGDVDSLVNDVGGVVSDVGDKIKEIWRRIFPPADNTGTPGGAPAPSNGGGAAPSAPSPSSEGDGGLGEAYADSPGFYNGGEVFPGDGRLGELHADLPYTNYPLFRVISGPGGNTGTSGGATEPSAGTNPAPSETTPPANSGVPGAEPPTGGGYANETDNEYVVPPYATESKTPRKNVDAAAESHIEKGFYQNWLK